MGERLSTLRVSIAFAFLAGVVHLAEAGPSEAGAVPVVVALSVLLWALVGDRRDAEAARLPVIQRWNCMLCGRHADLVEGPDQLLHAATEADATLLREWQCPAEPRVGHSWMLASLNDPPAPPTTPGPRP